MSGVERGGGVVRWRGMEWLESGSISISLNHSIVAEVAKQTVLSFFSKESIDRLFGVFRPIRHLSVTKRQNLEEDVTHHENLK